MEIKFNSEEKYNLGDVCAYLKQYEDSIVWNNDKSMLPFCADIAMKRLFIANLASSKLFDGKKYVKSVISDIEEHIANGRTTESTRNNFLKTVKKRRS
jgi:hypothetical protein